MQRASALTAPDYAVLAAFLAALLGIGLLFRRQTSTREFFLGDRRIPAWAACLSFVATEVSAVTIVSVPGIAYAEGWKYAQFFVGSAVARVIIALLFIPAFYALGCTTIYQLLGRRFGGQTQVAGALFFFLTRLLGSGVRLMAASLAVSVLLGWHIVPAILLFTAISVAYIAAGGIQAGVWASALQGLAILGGGLAAAGFLASQAPGGILGIVEVAGAAGRLDVLDWGPAPGSPGYWGALLTNPNLVWLAALNGLFTSLAAFGTDHDLMQRLLTVETRAASQRTMLATIPASLGLLLLYLGIGAGLYAFFQANPAITPPEASDKVFPFFIAEVMPPLLRGLLLSAVVLASIDSPLASLSASFVTDIYRPLVRKDASEEHYVRVSRGMVAAFGALLAALAYGFSFFDKILWVAFKIGGVTFGSLLGVFLLALLTRRTGDRGNVVAMVASALVMLTLLILSEAGVIALAWTWLIILGTLATFGLGWLLGERAR